MLCLSSPPGPGALPALRAVRRCLDDAAPAARLLVACSGGADSLALLLTVAELTRPTGPLHDLRGLVGVLHVDHGLRPESGAEGDLVAQVCSEVGLPLRRVRVDATVGSDGRPRQGGPEAGARQARREAYAAHLGPGDFLLLGHTADDQAEQVLLAMARGAGLRAVAGIAPRAELPLGTPEVAATQAGAPAVILRPLLGLRRAQTEATCQAFGVDFVRDPSNRADGPWRAADGTALRRAAVRERALPALAAALGVDPIPALARTAAQARTDLEALDLLAARLYQDALLETGSPTQAQQQGGGEAATSAINAQKNCGQGEEINLDCALLLAAPPALRSRVLHLAGRQVGWQAGAINSAHIDALDALVTKYRGQKETHLPGNVRARRSGATLRIWRQETQ